MSSITIPNLDEDLEQSLRLRAVQHGRSIEEEARDILRSELSRVTNQTVNLADAIRARFAPMGGLDLPSLPRDPIREPPELGQ